MNQEGHPATLKTLISLISLLKCLSLGLKIKLLNNICIVLVFLGQRGKFSVARNQQILLEVSSVWSHL